MSEIGLTSFKLPKLRRFTWTGVVGCAGIVLSYLVSLQMVTAARAIPPEQEGKSVDKNVEAANKLFPCPKAKWDVVKQPFWRHRTIPEIEVVPMAAPTDRSDRWTGRRPPHNGRRSKDLGRIYSQSVQRNGQE